MNFYAVGENAIERHPDGIEPYLTRGVVLAGTWIPHMLNVLSNNFIEAGFSIGYSNTEE